MHVWWTVVEPSWTATNLRFLDEGGTPKPQVSVLRLNLVPPEFTIVHWGGALQPEIQHLWLWCRLIKRISQRPGCCQCPRVMANASQAEESLSSLCIAARITQSHSKLELCNPSKNINGNRLLCNWKHRSRTQDVLASVVFHLLVMQMSPMTIWLFSWLVLVLWAKH